MAKPKRMTTPVVCILAQDTYQPGDLPPEGYLAWHEWAEVQRQAGIRQVTCGQCGRWKTPQELSAVIEIYELKRRTGPVTMTRRVCITCAAKGH